MNSVALITGAGSGIGRACAIEMARQGYDLALVGRTQGTLDESVKICGRGLAIAADVADAGQVELAVNQTMGKFGRIDALIHCAGWVVARDINQMSLDEWRKTIDVNLSAVFYFCRLLWPIWAKHGGGAVVNVSSEAARDPFPGLSAYGAAKAGVNLLGLALAREGQSHKIRVYTVAPSATETKMFRSLATVEQFPTANTMEPAAVAKVVAGCVSGDLGYCSGEVIYMHKQL